MRRFRFRRMVWVSVFALAFAPAARADLVRNISTGFDNATGTLLPTFSTDTDFTVTGPGGATFFGQARAFGPALPSSYLSDAALPGSRFLYLVTTPGDTGFPFVPSGDFTFRTTVDLTGFDPETALIRDLRTAADNSFVSVAVNGQVVFSRTPPQTAEEFGSVLVVGDVGLGAFREGLNTIDLTIRNTGFGFGDGPSPGAFRAQATVEADVATQAVAEPSGLALLGFAVVTWLAGRHYRRWR